MLFLSPILAFAFLLQNAQHPPGISLARSPSAPPCSSASFSCLLAVVTHPLLGARRTPGGEVDAVLASVSCDHQVILTGCTRMNASGVGRCSHRQPASACTDPWQPLCQCRKLSSAQWMLPQAKKPLITSLAASYLSHHCTLNCSGFILILQSLAKQPLSWRNV